MDMTNKNGYLLLASNLTSEHLLRKQQNGNKNHQ